MNKIAIYPGSFDPVTNGHTNIIHRAAKLFDKIIVAVLNNVNKSYWFSKEERVSMLVQAIDLEKYPNIEIIVFDGLLIDLMKQKQATVVVRGLRAVSDYEYELQMHLTNQTISHNEIETVFLPSSRENLYLSSSLIREIAKFNGCIDEFVSPKIKEAIMLKEKK